MSQLAVSRDVRQILRDPVRLRGVLCHFGDTKALAIAMAGSDETIAQAVVKQIRASVREAADYNAHWNLIGGQNGY